MPKQNLTTRELAGIIFGQFFPREFLKQFEGDSDSENLAIRDSFISHFEGESKVPKYDEDDSRFHIIAIAKKEIIKQEIFLNHRRGEDGTFSFDFSVFDPLFMDKNTPEENN